MPTKGLPGLTFWANKGIEQARAILDNLVTTPSSTASICSGQNDILFFKTGAFLQIAFTAGKLQIVQSPFVSAVYQRNNMVNVKVLAVYTPAAFHTDASISGINHLSHQFPVCLHEKIAQTAWPAKGVLVAHGSVAADAAQSSASSVFAPGEALGITLAFAITHDLLIWGCGDKVKIFRSLLSANVFSSSFLARSKAPFSQSINSG